MLILTQTAAQGDDTLHMIVGAGCILAVVLAAILIIYKS